MLSDSIFLPQLLQNVGFITNLLARNTTAVHTPVRPIQPVLPDAAGEILLKNVRKNSVDTG